MGVEVVGRSAGRGVQGSQGKSGSGDRRRPVRCLCSGGGSASVYVSCGLGLRVDVSPGVVCSNWWGRRRDSNRG